jgi:hypothetical protein
MDSEELSGAIQEISDRFEEFKQAELQKLAEKIRRYPDGFKFFYPTLESLEESCVLGAFINPEIDDTQVWYRCLSPFWTPESNQCMPLSEKAIARAIEKFGIPQ